MMDRLKRVLADGFEVDESIITEEAALMATLDLDSLDVVDLVVLVEHNFGVTLARADFDNIVSFGDLRKLISSRIDGE